MNAITTTIQENTTIMTTEGRNYEADFIRFLDASPKTVKTYAKAIKPFTSFLAFRGVSPMGATREDVIAYRNELRAKYKAATITLYITVVKLFYQWAEGAGLARDVAEHIKGARIGTEHKRDYLTTAQIKKILSKIDMSNETGARDFAMFSLMASSGLRTIEVSRANIEDLRTLGDGRVLYVQGKGKNDKAASVEVAPEVDEAIQRYISIAGKPEPGAPLFRSAGNHKADGGRMATESISRIIKTRLRSAGIDDDRLTAHSLRHTAATLNLLNGGTLEETQKLLRHERINTTMIYSHALDNITNKSASRVAAAIFA